MPLRVVAHCIERFPGRRRDTSGLLELALGVLDAFRRQMERGRPGSAYKPAPNLISAEKSVTVEQPEHKTGSEAKSSIAYGVTQQQPPSKKRRLTGRFASSRCEVIDVSEDSGSPETSLGGNKLRQVCGAVPLPLGARSAHEAENCGDNFSIDSQAEGTDLTEMVSFPSPSWSVFVMSNLATAFHFIRSLQTLKTALKRTQPKVGNPYESKLGCFVTRLA